MRKRYSSLLAFLSLFVFWGCSGTRPELGVQNGQLIPCPSSPNCVSSQAKDQKHAVEAIVYAGDVKDALQALTTLLQAEERVEIVSAKEDYIRAEYTSALFRFVDDVEFHITEKEKGKSIIHARSASRLGYSDLGVNRKRIERIRGQLQSR